MMNALQARLAFVALLLITAAISYNAIYLQDGRHPAPISTAAEKTSAKRKATPRRIPRSLKKPVARQGEAVSSAGTIKAVQRELTSRGYEPGPVDGVAGLLTRAAIMAFQHDRGLSVTGAVTEDLLQSIVLGGSAKEKTASADTRIPKQTTELIRAIQQVLSKLGYDPGPIDGVPGGGTRRAIEAFERVRGLPMTGRISGKLINELVRATGGKIASLAREPGG